ncbi:MAG TPA: hypothetical protein VIV40_05860 [Kofleriaceae bacterium]
MAAITTTAAAQPKQEETSGRVSLNEKQNKKANAPRHPGDWVELASPTPAKHGTEFVVIGKEAGYFSKLRVDAAKGKTIVRKVKVFFDDGKVKNVEINKTLTEGKWTIVDLGDTKAIDRIVITTEPDTSGEYAIYGSSAGGVVGSR